MDLISAADKRKKHLADAACLLVALIWGSGFVACQYAIDAGMSSSLIVTLRFVIASISLLPFCVNKLRKATKADVVHGVWAGVILFFAFFTQTYGQMRTTVSHAAFLTATNVVMIPFLVWIFQKKRPEGKIFVLALTTLIGIGILTYSAGEVFNINGGDWIILLCALGFAVHIFYLGRAVEGREPIVINFIQLATAGIVSAVALGLFESEQIMQANFKIGLPSVLFLGLMNTCVCFMLQTWAQKHIHQSRAGILLSTEGLFGSLFAVMLGMEPLTATMVCGGLIIVMSLVFLEIQLPAKKKK